MFCKKMMFSLGLRRLPRTKFSVRSFVSNITDPSLVPTARELEDHLVQQGATFNPKVSIQLYDRYGGLGLTATRKIEKFEPIAVVPRSLCVEAPTIEDLAVNVHRHLTTVDRSKLTGIWKFLKYLYNYANLVSPIMWGEKQEQQLVNAYYPEIEPDVLLQWIAEKRNHLKLVNEEPKFKFDKFLTSVVLVESRCYELDEGSMNSQLLASMIESPDLSEVLSELKANYNQTVQRQAQNLRFDPVLGETPAVDVIVPFIDLMNHSSSNDNCYVIYNQTKREFHAVAAKTIPAGAQIFVDYGFHDDPAGLLMQYGIAPPMKHKGHSRRESRMDERTASIVSIMQGKKDDEEQQQEEGEEGEAPPTTAEERAKRDTIKLIGFIAQYRQASGDRFIPM